jgi:hypothetical protein
MVASAISRTRSPDNLPSAMAMAGTASAPEPMDLVQQ